MREIILWTLIIISIPVVWRRPFIGLIIYLAANIVRPEMLFWGGKGGEKIFLTYYILIVFSCFVKGYVKRIGSALQREYLLMLWMLAAIYLSILFSNIQTESSYYYATELLKAFGICALLYILITDFSDVQQMQLVLLGCFTFLGIWGIEQQLLGNERLEGLGGNSWGDSNGVAAVYVLFLPVALAKVYIAEKRRNYWIALGMVFVMTTLVVCTKSRGGLLGLITCFFAFGFFARKTFHIFRIAVILAVMAMPFMGASYFERMKTMNVSDSENLESSARSRLILWQAGLLNFKDNPILGTGFLTYPEAKMRYEVNFSSLEEDFRNYVFRKENMKVTHNTYIQMLSDCGLVGAIPYVLLVLGGSYKGVWVRRNMKQSSAHDPKLLMLSGLSAGIIGFAVCIFFIDAIMSTFFYYQMVSIGVISRFFNSPKSKSNFDDNNSTIVVEKIA